MRILLCTIALCLGWTSASAENRSCAGREGVYLQVLGSGGPIADDGRASSAYLVWIDGKSRVMIDAGGGSFLRFGQAAASFADLDFVGISHFHTDHSADFPALLKSGYFSDRKRSLSVAGPDGGGPFPGLLGYLRSLLNPQDGAYGYLSGYLDGSGGLVRLDAQAVSGGEPKLVYEDRASGLRVDAMHVPHGIVPAIGFRVKVGDITIVFSSDQNGSDARFVDFAKGATLLVMHMTIPEGAGGSAVQLHARPSDLGRIAAAARAETLVLSHFMARSLRNFKENLSAVRSAYEGQVVAAEDLFCIEAHAPSKRLASGA